MSKNQIPLLFFMSFVGIALGYSQSQTGIEDTPEIGPRAPEETEIILPDIVLDLEDPELTTLTDFLPETSGLRLQTSRGVLPEFGEYTLTSESISTLLSTSITAGGEGQVKQTAESENTIFIRGEVGTGLHQYLNGDVSIIKLGNNPDLTIDFTHSSRDGGFRGTTPLGAGSGFLSQDTRFGAGVGITLPRFDLGVDGFIGGQQDGLQGLVEDGYATSLQTLGLAPQIELYFEDFLSMQAGMEYSLTRRFFSGSDVAQFDEYDNSVWAVNADLGLFLEQPDYQFSGNIRYDVGQVSDAYWMNFLRPGLKGYWQITPQIGASATVAGVFDLGRKTYVPFKLGTDIGLSPGFQLQVSGGYEVQPYRFREVLNENHLVDTQVPDNDLFERRWVAQVGSIILPMDEMSIEVGLTFSGIERELQTQAFTNPIYPLQAFSGYRLEPDLTLLLRPLEELSFTLGYQGQLISSDPETPIHRFDFVTDFQHSSSAFGAAFETVFPIFEEPQIPILGLSGWVALGGTVDLELRIHDPLSLAIPEGRLERPGLSDFIDTGFRIELTSSINL
ncbi:hypothetical protein [Spirochaeta lutea]|uniref:TonB-dependent receptor-like beta-barrel domain-containing protein n=1 Tax=Spirochaeta lutea TaxID=1480694 RepID=A0A098R4V5_9SPIO|nr:hypothetical protein [Spirochaeta lutea]KGE73782.1 hypothetical protein DC28_00720 [Spirochaeta lutea]